MPIDYRASADFLAARRRTSSTRAPCSSAKRSIATALGRPRPIWHVVGVAAVRRTASDDRLNGDLRAEAAELQRDSAATADDAAEIIFTSGATAEPKGVVITHRNILANIVPIEREMAKYKKYARPFLPIRFLNLLPLSHMFGQAMATFVPPMLPGVVVFTRSYAPEDIVRQIRDRRISVLVCVPKMLEVLKDHVLRVAPEAADAPARCTGRGGGGSYRRIHRMFGFKFWAMVVGAAPLDPELEAFWGRLGFLVIQGYGLTETAPIVTLEPSASCRAWRGRQADRRRRSAHRGGRRDPGAGRERHHAATSTHPRRRARRSRTAGFTPATSASSMRRASFISAAARRK